MKNFGQQILFTAMIFGFAACGNEPVVGTLAPPPPPTVSGYNYNNTASGCIGTQVQDAFFGTQYDVVREQYMPSYQCALGNVHIVSAVSIGSTQIPAGNYGWKDLYDRVTGAMNNCCIVNGSNAYNVWASVNYNNFGSNGYLGGVQQTNSQVTFDRPGVSSDFRNIVAMMAQLNSQYYYQMSRQYPQQVYYYGAGPTNGNSMFGGLSYGGNGFSLNFGGMFNF